MELTDRYVSVSAVYLHITFFPVMLNYQAYHIVLEWAGFFFFKLNNTKHR